MAQMAFYGKDDRKKTSMKAQSSTVCIIFKLSLLSLQHLILAAVIGWGIKAPCV